ncbi:MAG: hypothetical protein V1755_08360, partial [Chloroflexota bacterium]
MIGQTRDDILNDAIVREARWAGRQIPYEAGATPRSCVETRIPMSEIKRYQPKSCGEIAWEYGRPLES